MEQESFDTVKTADLLRRVLPVWVVSSGQTALASVATDGLLVAVDCPIQPPFARVANPKRPPCSTLSIVA
jgi:hypothetical protein